MEYLARVMIAAANRYGGLAERLRQGSRHGDQGATAVEYGLMVALIAVVIIGAVTLLGGNLSTMFTSVANEIAGV